MWLLSRLAGEADCVVLQSTLPWNEVKNWFRNHAAKGHYAGGWCLYPDINEQFTFEGAALHGAPPERHWVRQTRRALV